MQQETKNLVLAVAVSVTIIFGYNVFFGTDKSKTNNIIKVNNTKINDTANSATKIELISRENAIALSNNRVSIKNNLLTGSLDLKGAKIDDISFVKYYESVYEKKNVALLSPKGSYNTYYAFFGWKSDDTEVPDENTVWQSDKTVLTKDSPVKLKWKNKDDVEFIQTIFIDDEYMINAKLSVRNGSKKIISIRTVGNIVRSNVPDTKGFIVHEGPIGVFEGKLKEIKYEKIVDENNYAVGSNNNGSGWIGITDKYWLVSLIPDEAQSAYGKFSHYISDSMKEYYTNIVSSCNKLSPGSVFNTNTNLFIGAKQLSILDKYSDSLKINHFDLAIDFGWFYFITKPIFYILSFLKWLCGNFGIAIILLTLAIKIIFLPLSIKSYRSMALMKKTQPKIEQLKSLYKDDKQRLNQELIALYRREKVNPASGILPIIIQIPVFFALYKVLSVSIEMRHAQFFWWVKDLSIADTSNIFTLFGLINWNTPSFLKLGLWPILMSGSMILQNMFNSSPMITNDKTQKLMFTYFMPCMFAYMLSQFPVGLIIYWTFNNIFTIIQQLFITRYFESRLPDTNNTKWKK